MSHISVSDTDFIKDHRKIWAKRPELRYVYQGWFRQLQSFVGELDPVVEIGSGPGFLKEYWPTVISTDVMSHPWIDLVCNASNLPFASGSVGGVVMLDVLHHLDNPLRFMGQVKRVLKPAGRLVMIEPWISPFSYVLYRYFHHEDCSLSIDLNHCFEPNKNAFDGNAAIPFKLFQHDFGKNGTLRLVNKQTFLALPYLATLGFTHSHRIPDRLIRFAQFCEQALRPLKRVTATRVLAVWENS
jgi:SAM-dependent methyltransferase